MKAIALQATGYTFLVLGVLGLFLPFLQGFLFLFIGVLLLSRESELVRRQVDRLRARYPKIGRSMDEAEAWTRKQWNRLRGYPR